MSPPAAVLEAGTSTLGRLPERETHDWAAVVARHTRDDWPPPEWLAVMVEYGNDAHEAPAPEQPGRLAA